MATRLSFQVLGTNTRPESPPFFTTFSINWYPERENDLLSIILLDYSNTYMYSKV